MMNILLINYEYPPIGAGAANATYNIAKCMVREGHEVTVLTSRFGHLKGYRKEDGICVYRTPAIRRKAAQSNIFEMLTFVLSAFFTLPFIARKKKIDAAIVFFSFPCGPLGLWGKISAKIPYVVSLRGGDVPGNEASLNPLHTLLTPVRRLVFKHAEHIVANSDGLKQLSESADPFPVIVIPNGVDTDTFRPGSLPKKNGQILFVGRLQSQKNLLFLLEQFDILLNECKIVAELHIVGSGPMEKALQQYSGELDCRDNIFFHGWCNKETLRKCYRESLCLINPSFCEGMPNTVLEAMACGTTIVASRVPGNKELVDHGDTGFLFELTSPRDFRNFLAVLIKDPHGATSMGKKAYQKIKRFFSWEHVAGEYMKLVAFCV